MIEDMIKSDDNEKKPSLGEQKENSVRSFQEEYFILLTEEELKSLVSAQNRMDYHPALKGFLYARGKLNLLRRLAWESDDNEWCPPDLNLSLTGEIFDQENHLRGYRKTIRLPARPGEPQLALSSDWLWSAFSEYLIGRGIWTYAKGGELSLIYPENTELKIHKRWSEFWQKLSSTDHLEQSVGIFLDNKTLFKNQAKPWDSNDIPVLSKDMACFLKNYYQKGKGRNRHFKKGSIPKAIVNLERAIEENAFQTIPFPVESSDEVLKGGDFFLAGRGKAVRVRCSSCGQIISKGDSLERLAVFLKDADERPQSGRHKDDKNFFCIRCVATVFLCPVKLSPETLTVRLGFESNGDDFKSAERTIEMEHRKFVAQSLHVNAGNFISLHLTEFSERKPLAQIWGVFHYSLWKMATTFPPELFAEGFQVEVYPGEETFRLPRWALWCVSALAEWDNVFGYWCYADKSNRSHTGRFLRLIARGKVFQAFYALISGGLIKEYAHTWRMNRLQEIWIEFETLLKEEKSMPIPDYPIIAGFAGLLLPLAERVQSSKKTPEEKKRAVGKLLEEADRPIQYAYTAARETGSPDFIFCKRPRNRFFYEKAVALLEWAGEDIDRLREEAEEKTTDLSAKDQRFEWMREAEEKIFICPDQITRVTSALVKENEKPYENEADWRSFAYQVKLALWSMFPQYLGSQEKKERN